MSKKLIIPENHDCHIHTCYSSDSILSCKKILDTAIKKKLELIAVTDHNTLKGGLAVKKLAKKYPGIKVIAGAEIKTEYGEIIGLNLTKEIKSRKLLSVVKEIKTQGGYVSIPHPFRWNKPRLPIDKIKKYVDYIEIYNGRNLTTFSNVLARRLAAKYGFGSIRGSDSHLGFEIGNSSMKVLNWRGTAGFFITGFYKILIFAWLPCF